MEPTYNPAWLTLLVATLFTMLIVLPSVVVSIIYPLVLIAGSWTTVNRRKYPLPDYRHPKSATAEQPESVAQQEPVQQSAHP